MPFIMCHCERLPAGRQEVKQSQRIATSPCGIKEVGGFFRIIEILLLIRSDGK
jgi:hypothetical protein